jgi:hypothetical protein
MTDHSDRTRDDTKTTAKPAKLAEIATRIAAHLHRIEFAQPDRGSAKSGYWNTCVRPAGSRIAVCYISYQGSSKLTKADAIEYLAWLDAGNVGRHWTALSFNQRIRAGAEVKP